MISVLFVGLGAMGLPMARRLSQCDVLQLTTFDLQASARAAGAEFGVVADSIESALAKVDVICTMVPADSHVRSLAAAVAAHGRADQIFVDFSTTSAAAIADVAELLRESGIRTVSASCMRGVNAARDGSLTLFVGGSADVLRTIDPILRNVATEIHDVGTLAAAKGLKLVNNYIVSASNLAIAEAAVAAGVFGYSPAETLDALRAGGIDGWVVSTHIAAHMLSNNLPVGIFSVDYMAKDVELASALAASAGLPLHFSGQVLIALRGAAAMGLSAHYHPIVVNWVQRCASVDSFVNVGADRRVAEPAGGLAAIIGATRVAIDLATHAGIRLAPFLGLEALDAARWLAIGSAQNATLDRLSSQSSSDLSDIASSRAVLAEARRLAQNMRLPMAMIETAWNALGDTVN